MKRYFPAAIAVLGLCAAASAAPQAVYQNSIFLTNPPVVDAVTFVNSGVMDFINEQENDYTLFTENILPFSTRDTLYYTNADSGIMYGNPGFRFDTATATTRHSAKTFVNNGFIYAVDTITAPLFPTYSGTIVYLPSTGLAEPSVLSVAATNIINGGTMEVGNDGWLTMSGQTLSNRYGTLIAGDLTGNDQTDVTAIQDAFLGSVANSATVSFRYFIAPGSLSDLYWGFTNGNLALDVAGPSFPSTPITFSRVRGTLDTFTYGFSLPVSDIVISNGVTNVNLGDLAEFAIYIYTYPQPGALTNFYYNVVFVNTNFADANISYQVRFARTSDVYFDDALPAPTPDPNGYEDIVQFSVPSLDVTTGQMTTNAIYLQDDGAVSSNAVVYVYTNAISANGYGRPDYFKVATTMPVEWPSAFPSNDVADVPNINAIFYPGYTNTYTARSVPYAAAAYGAQVGWDPETLDGSFPFTDEALVFTDLEEFTDIPDPTAQPGQINLQAAQMDLTGARIRAEGMVTLQATNLTRGATAGVDWGAATGTLGATNGVLLISNIFPTSFQRIRGDVFAWSGNWVSVGTNAFSTNTYMFHVLVVDQTLRGNFSPTVRNLTLHGKKSTDVEDPLTVINQSLFDASNLTFNSTMTFNQNASSLVSSNMPNLRNFLNNTNGVLFVSDLLDLGMNLTAAPVSPAAQKYTINSITNLGEIVATSPDFQSANFENDGIIYAQEYGSILIAASNLGCGLATGQTNYLAAAGGITLSAQSMQFTNSLLYTGLGVSGSLVLDATLHLGDGVSGAPAANPNLVNFWQVSDGFNLLVKPVTGDLFGTEIRTTAGSNQVVNHVWAGVDKGTNFAAGYSNNVVIGHLILDRLASSATLQFSAAGSSNALYVDYLELADFSYSDYRNGLEIGPGMKIYFAAANADPIKLMAVHPGLIWASNFWGPNSSVAIYYKDLGTNVQCLMNSAVVSNLDYGFFSVPNYYNLTNVLNDPNNPTNIAPCPSENGTHVYVIGTPGVGGRTVYTSLITGISGDGTVTPVLQQDQLALGSNYTLTATPATGWLFSGWSASGVPLANPSTNVLMFTFTNSTVITANFIPTPFPAGQGVYNGLFFDTNGVTPDSSGKFTLTMTKTGAFSGVLLVQTNSYSFTGQFGGTGIVQVQAKAAKQPPLTVNLALDMTGVSDEIHGDVSNGVWDSQLSADLAPVFTTKAPSPLAGGYTLCLPWSSGIVSTPGGDGYGVVTVSPLGVASVAGSLADGVAFSQSAPISKYDNWPFYTYISSGGDTVIGWIGVSTNGLAGTNTSWSKAPGKGPYYAAGFTNILQLLGSTYVVPKKNATVLSLTSPTVTISGGDLAESLTNSVTQKSETYSAGTNATLTISTGNGSFSGKFYDPNTRKAQTFNGVVLQNQGAARGYFLGTNESGAVLLEGN
ncbi:MAG: hypothetical protein ABSG59_11755 [Verrucomicrobiota bacterium]|jgi:hypothetical protein